MSRKLVLRRWILGWALIVLTSIAVWQYPRGTTSPRPEISWANVSKHDLVTAALYLDVQEGGPRLALTHLASLALRDTSIQARAHAYAHEIGRYAVGRRDWDPRVYAECTPQFEAGCYHGLVEAYLNHLPKLDETALRPLCDRISGSLVPEVARRECAHGLGHGLWFRLHGDYTEALSQCDGLPNSAAQEECRDGVFMQRAGAVGVHAHHHSSGMVPATLNCPQEPVRYRKACWQYQGRLFVAAGGYPKAFTECDAAAEYLSVCYWGLGKWIADRVRSAGGSDE